MSRFDALVGLTEAKAKRIANERFQTLSSYGEGDAEIRFQFSSYVGKPSVMVSLVNDYPKSSISLAYRTDPDTAIKKIDGLIAALRKVRKLVKAAAAEKSRR